MTLTVQSNFTFALLLLDRLALLAQLVGLVLAQMRANRFRRSLEAWIVRIDFHLRDDGHHFAAAIAAALLLRFLVGLFAARFRVHLVAQPVLNHEADAACTRGSDCEPLQRCGTCLESRSRARTAAWQALYPWPTDFAPPAHRPEC